MMHSESGDAQSGAGGFAERGRGRGRGDFRGGRGRGGFGGGGRGGYGENRGDDGEHRGGWGSRGGFGENRGGRGGFRGDGDRGGFRGGRGGDVEHRGGFRGDGDRGGFRGGRGGDRGGFRGGEGGWRGGRGRGGRGGGDRGGRGGFGYTPRQDSDATQLPADYKFPTLVDIGVNLSHKRFKHDLADIITRSVERGVKKMVVTGTSLRESINSVELCGKYPEVLYCTVGVHPHDAKTCNESTIDELRKLAGNACVRAIGECGLDFDRNFSPQPVQEMWFKKQLELAEELKMPVFLHERAAHASFINILSPFLERGLRSVVHCFTGTSEEAQAYLKYPSVLLGLTATCTHKNDRGARIREILESKVIPLERLMIETDAPFMTPHNIPASFNHNTDRNDPSLLWCVCDTLAKIYGVTPEIVAEITTKNAVQFFGITV